VRSRVAPCGPNRGLSPVSTSVPNPASSRSTQEHLTRGDFRVTGCFRCSWVFLGADLRGLKIRVSVVRFRPWPPSNQIVRSKTCASVCPNIDAGVQYSVRCSLDQHGLGRANKHRLGVTLLVPSLLPASCTSVLHQRGNLHELDARANAVETCHALQKRFG